MWSMASIEEDHNAPEKGSDKYESYLEQRIYLQEQKLGEYKKSVKLSQFEQQFASLKC